MTVKNRTSKRLASILLALVMLLSLLPTAAFAEGDSDKTGAGGDDNSLTDTNANGITATALFSVSDATEEVTDDSEHSGKVSSLDVKFKKLSGDYYTLTKTSRGSENSYTALTIPAGGSVQVASNGVKVKLTAPSGENASTFQLNVASEDSYNALTVTLPNGATIWRYNGTDGTGGTGQKGWEELKGGSDSAVVKIVKSVSNKPDVLYLVSGTVTLEGSGNNASLLRVQGTGMTNSLAVHQDNASKVTVAVSGGAIKVTLSESCTQNDIIFNLVSNEGSESGTIKKYTWTADNTSFTVGGTDVTLTAGGVKLDKDEFITGASGKTIKNTTGSTSTIEVTADSTTGTDVVTLSNGQKVTIADVQYTAGTADTKLSVTSSAVTLTKGSVKLDNNKTVYVLTSDNVENVLVTNTNSGGSATITVSANTDTDTSTEYAGVAGYVTVPCGKTVKVGGNSYTAGSSGNAKIAVYTDGTSNLIDGSITLAAKDGDTVESISIGGVLVQNIGSKAITVTESNSSTTEYVKGSCGTVTIPDDGSAKFDNVEITNFSDGPAVNSDVKVDVNCGYLYVDCPVTVDSAYYRRSDGSSGQVKINPRTKNVSMPNGVIPPDGESTYSLRKGEFLVIGSYIYTAGDATNKGNSADESKQSGVTITTNGAGNNPTVTLANKGTSVTVALCRSSAEKKTVYTAAADNTAFKVTKSSDPTAITLLSKNDGLLGAAIQVEDGVTVKATDGTNETTITSIDYTDGVGNETVHAVIGLEGSHCVTLVSGQGKSTDGRMRAKVGNTYKTLSTTYGSEITCKVETVDGKEKLSLTVPENKTVTDELEVKYGVGSYTFTAADTVVAGENATVTSKDGKSAITGVTSGNTTITIVSDGSIKLTGGTGSSTNKMAVQMGETSYSFEKTTGEEAYSYNVAESQLSVPANVTVKDANDVKYTGNGTFTFGADGTVTVSENATVTGTDGVAITGVAATTGGDATTTGGDATKVRIDNNGKLTLIDGQGKVTGAATTGTTVTVEYTVGEATTSGEATKTVYVTVPANETYIIDMDATGGVPTVTGLNSNDTVTVKGDFGTVTLTAGNNSTSFPIDASVLKNGSDKAEVAASANNLSIALGSEGTDPKVVISNNTDKITVTKSSNTDTAGTVKVAKTDDTFTVGSNTYTAGTDGAGFTVKTVEGGSQVTITDGTAKLTTAEYANSVYAYGKLVTNTATGEQQVVTVTSAGTVTIPAQGSVTINSAALKNPSKTASVNVTIYSSENKVTAEAFPIIVTSDGTNNGTNNYKYTAETGATNAKLVISTEDGRVDSITAAVVLTADYSLALEADEAITIGSYTYSTGSGTNGDVTIKGQGAGKNPAVVLNGADNTVSVKYNDSGDGVTYTAVNAGTTFAMTGTDTNAESIVLLDNNSTTEGANSKIKVVEGVSVTDVNNTITAKEADVVIELINGNVTLTAKKGGAQGKMYVKHGNNSYTFSGTPSATDTTAYTFNVTDGKLEVPASVIVTDTANGVQYVGKGTFTFQANKTVKPADGSTVKSKDGTNEITGVSEDNTQITIDSEDGSIKLTGGSGSSTTKMTANIAGVSRSFDGNGKKYTVDTSNGTLTLNVEDASVKMAVGEKTVTFSGKTNDSFTLAMNGDKLTATIPAGALVVGSDGVSVEGVNVTNHLEVCMNKGTTKVEIDQTTGVLKFVGGHGVVKVPSSGRTTIFDTTYRASSQGVTLEVGCNKKVDVTTGSLWRSSYHVVSYSSIYAVRNGTNAASGTDYSGGVYGLIFRAGVSSIKSVQVDGRTIGTSNYTTEGSYPVELYLKAAYLRTLAKGSHTLTVLYDGGSLTTGFTIGGVSTSSATATGTSTGSASGLNSSPVTGDAGVAIYAAMGLLSLTGGALTVSRRRKKS